jgi:hypothetical protein
MGIIKYYFDSISIEESEMTIFGWAYADGSSKVKIEIVDVENFELEEKQRLDIYEKFDEQKDALNSGFKIKMPYMKKFQIIFSTETETLKQKVNIKNMMGQKKPATKLRILLHYINPYNIIKLINNIRHYGFKETFYKIKGKLRMSRLHLEQVMMNGLERKSVKKKLEQQRNHKFDYEPK